MNNKINLVLSALLLMIILAPFALYYHQDFEVSNFLLWFGRGEEYSAEPKRVNNNTSDTCVYGDISCIDNIRVVFRNTGKDVLGEQYIGDGLFEIQFIEYGKGTFNASVLVDCECNISAAELTVLN